PAQSFLCASSKVLLKSEPHRNSGGLSTVSIAFTMSSVVGPQAWAWLPNTANVAATNKAYRYIMFILQWPSNVHRRLNGRGAVNSSHICRHAGVLGSAPPGDNQMIGTYGS